MDDDGESSTASDLVANDAKSEVDLVASTALPFEDNDDNQIDNDHSQSPEAVINSYQTIEGNSLITVDENVHDNASDLEEQPQDVGESVNKNTDNVNEEVHDEREDADTERAESLNDDLGGEAVSAYPPPDEPDEPPLFDQQEILSPPPAPETAEFHEQQASEMSAAHDKPELVTTEEPQLEEEIIECTEPLAPPPLLSERNVIPEQVENLSNVLNMCWSFGLNASIPVINLSTQKYNAIFYTSAQTGIIYDYTCNTQKLLQGHFNAISCTCVSNNKRWIVTGDKGPNSMVVVWDSTSYIPVKTIFDDNPEGGIVCCAMTIDSRFLATVSASATQILSIWDWTTDAEIPICTAELQPSLGVQSYILFNPEDITQVVTNSETRAVFYSWKGGKIDYYAPILTDNDFNRPVGKFTQSIFFSNSPRALTATSFGNVVVWDSNLPVSQAAASDATPDKKALKMVKLQEKGINVLSTTDSWIVMADASGYIKFYDQTLALVYAYLYLHINAPINSVSFLYNPEFHHEVHKSDYPIDASLQAKSFVARNFIISTTTGIIAHLQTEGTNMTIIQKYHDFPINALSTHPYQPILTIGGDSGLLQLWQYIRRLVIASRMFEQGMQIRVCCYDPKGEYIAVGFSNGVVNLVDALSLNDVLQKPFHYTNETITHIAFSYDSAFMAVADAGYVVTLYKKDCHVNAANPYKYIGRYKSHYKPIRELVFGLQLDSNKPRLLSLGEDRVLVEYDLENVSKNGFTLLSRDRLEQSAVPLCMTWYPQLSKESFFLTANNEFKMKLYNITTKMCRKTIRCPTFGSPLKKLMIISADDSDELQKSYVAFINNDKVGVAILPLDGNPHNASAITAHAQGVGDMVASHDHKFLFTTGRMDATVNMWIFNRHALEAQSKLGGDGIVPFYSLLDNGHGGEQFREIEQLFYYAQIKNQGIDSQLPREVSTKISTTEIPYMMRALGFYPSEQDIEEMLNEVKFSTYVETSNYTTHIDLADFIRLYLNHRPVFGLEMAKLAWAFKVIASLDNSSDTIGRDKLLYLLQNNGEAMTENELAEKLSILLGFSAEGGSIEGKCELPPVEPVKIEDLDRALPYKFTAKSFAESLLGLHGSIEDETSAFVEPREFGEQS